MNRRNWMAKNIPPIRILDLSGFPSASWALAPLTAVEIIRIHGNSDDEIRRKMMVEGNVSFQIDRTSGIARIIDPPRKIVVPDLISVPVPMRRGKQIDPAKAKKARKR